MFKPGDLLCDETAHASGTIIMIIEAPTFEGPLGKNYVALENGQKIWIEPNVLRVYYTAVSVAPSDDDDYSD